MLMYSFSAECAYAGRERLWVRGCECQAVVRVFYRFGIASAITIAVFHDRTITYRKRRGNRQRRERVLQILCRKNDTPHVQQAQNLRFYSVCVRKIRFTPRAPPANVQRTRKRAFGTGYGSEQKPAIPPTQYVYTSVMPDFSIMLRYSAEFSISCL